MSPGGGRLFRVSRTKDADDLVRAAALDDVKAETFPWTVWGPHPVGALGAVWAVCPDLGTARKVCEALEAAHAR